MCMVPPLLSNEWQQPSIYETKFYWLFMLGKDLEHGCSRNLGPMLFTPALHGALIQFWTHAHQNTSPNNFFNWKKFAKKTKFKFKTQKKSNFGGLYTPKVRENKVKLDLYIWVSYCIAKKKTTTIACHNTSWDLQSKPPWTHTAASTWQNKSRYFTHTHTHTHTHIYSNFTNLLQHKLDLTYNLQCKDPMLQQQSHIWLALLLNQAGVLFVSA